MHTLPTQIYLVTHRIFILMSQKHVNSRPVTTTSCSCTNSRTNTRWPKKVSHYQMIKQSY